MDWKKAGNGHYAAGRYTDAVEAYTRGLEDRPGAPPPLSSRGTIGRPGGAGVGIPFRAPSRFERTLRKVFLYMPQSGSQIANPFGNEATGVCRGYEHFELDTMIPRLRSAFTYLRLAGID